MQPLDLAAARQRIAAAYDPTLLREAGHQLIDQLAGHLGAVMDSDAHVLPWRTPEQNVQDALSQLQQPPPHEPRTREQLIDRFVELAKLMLQRGHNLHDPRYIGHQVPANVPTAGLFDMIGAVTNQPMTVYDMGPWATAAEHALVEQLGACIGWPAGQFAGLVTHGGSLANLTALLTARNVALDQAWETGLPALPAERGPVLVVHHDTHYSVSRSAGVLGLGTNQVVRVGLDAQRRMDPRQLDATLRTLRAQRRPIVAVVACCCSTPVGAFDPLEPIADVCQQHGVWLHVDAAHGASACMSRHHRHRVAGLERADSLVWDATRCCSCPRLCAFVFFRDKQHQFEAFRQEAPYLFDPAAPGLAEYDSGLRTLECTKRAAAFGLWGVWSMHGPSLFEDLVDVTFDMGQQFHQKLTAAPDFQPVNHPQCNIVVFRHVPPLLGSAQQRAGGPVPTGPAPAHH